MFSKTEAYNLLLQAKLFFYPDPEDNVGPYTLNMNDVWCWACGDSEDVPEEELSELARLFWSYGWCGVLYWVSKRNDNQKSEFHDNNRFIEFVRQEENIRNNIPDSTKRAYTKIKYTIGKK